MVKQSKQVAIHSMGTTLHGFKIHSISEPCQGLNIQTSLIYLGVPTLKKSGTSLGVSSAGSGRYAVFLLLIFEEGYDYN